MANNDLISIVIPVYNASLFIEDTIKSIEKQTYPNYEAIFIDDCSNDNSIKIIEKYQKDNSKIKVIKLKKHKGVSFSRNIGIRQAKGKYLCFLDADDIWKENKLEAQIEFIKKNGYAFVYTAFKYINHEGTKISKKINVPLTLTYKEALLNTRILTITAMIDLVKIPKRYCYMPNIMNEDMATWWKILKKGHTAYAQNEILAYCRKAKKSRSSKKIRTAFYRWKLYRNIEKLGIFKSIYCFIHYAINGIQKRIGGMKSIPISKDLEVLVSTQNLKNDNAVEQLVKTMNISSKYLIVNQTLDNNIEIKNKNVITKAEKGLSKSRNVAIKESKEDIILFADDDVIYNSDYRQIILETYDKYPKADIICFYVESRNKKRKTKRMKTGKIGYIKSMRVVSFEISCKRNSLLKNNLKFDENFGIGAKNNRGEEQVFLYEAIKKGLNIIFVNKKIGEVLQEESSWLSKYDTEYFKIQGRIFKKLTSKYYMFLIIQYAIRKYHLYYKETTFLNAIKAMAKG